MGNDIFGLILKFFRILVERKKMIFALTAIPTLVSITYVLVVTPTYKSEAVVTPPSGGSGASPLESVLKETGMGGGLLGSVLGGGESGLNDCVTILESARLGRLMIDRFDLDSVYELRKKNKPYYFADAYKLLRKNFEYEITDENAIRIVARDESPDRARAMASHAIHLLDSLYIDVQRTQSRQKMEFVDRRLQMAEDEMRSVEDSLVAFQNRHNLIVPEAQVKLILENTAKTELRYATLQEEMAYEKALRGASSPRYHDLNIEMQLTRKALERQLRDETDTNSLLIPTHALPSLFTEYFRLERAYAIRLGVYKYLVQQIEALKLNADRDVQVISVVDPPWVNDKRISPKRRIVVQAVFILSLLFSVVLALVLNSWNQHRASHPETNAMLADLRKNLFRR